VNDRRPENWGYALGVLEFFATVREGQIDDWRLATSYHQIKAGDRIWIYATAPHRMLVGAGTAWGEPTGPVDGGWRIEIRWDQPLTQLLRALGAGSELLEANVQSVRALRPGESTTIAALLNASQAFEPSPLLRGRLRRLAEVTARQGQADFRRRLLDAYGGKCAISGYDVAAALQAAHVMPYDGPASNSTNNGLLLRADLHNLFDTGLIWVDDGRTVQVADSAKPTYLAFHGSTLREPKHADDLPHLEALRQHRIEVAGIEP